MKRIAGSIRTGMLYDSVWLHFTDEVRALGVYSVHPGADAIDAGSAPVGEILRDPGLSLGRQGSGNPEGVP